MKYRFALVLVTSIVFLSACGNDYSRENPAAAEQESIADTKEYDASVTSSEPDQNADGKNENGWNETEESVSGDYSSITEVEISFDFSRMSTKASNQISAWVEDEKGNVVRTIYVSDFAGARRGYRKREDAIPHWVAAADPDAMSDEEIDAVSSATLQDGSQSLVWDLTDNDGNAASKGKYTVKLEGTLFWSSNVVYSGTIDIENDEPGEIDVQEKRSEPGNVDNEGMIRNVTMIEKGG